MCISGKIIYGSYGFSLILFKVPPFYNLYTLDIVITLYFVYLICRVSKCKKILIWCLQIMRLGLYLIAQATKEANYNQSTSEHLYPYRNFDYKNLSERFNEAKILKFPKGLG